MRNMRRVARRWPSSPSTTASAASSGFDLAGEEAGFPPKNHIDAFHHIQRENFNITIHAGESFGTESIWQALQ